MHTDELQNYSVKLSLPNKRGWGTGFFVSPGLILTCAHVVKDATDRVLVRWKDQLQFAEAVVERMLPDRDLALLQFEPPQNDLPYVRLDDDIREGDSLSLFGYPDEDFPNGCPVTITSEGLTGDQPAFIKFKSGQIRPGMSGAALLNLRTGNVCGVLKFTRSSGSDLGGGGILARTVLDQFPELAKLHHRCRGESPYCGLRSFREEDADLFFGRNDATTFLYNLVQNNPVSIVVGSSGSGKSSLVYAGLLPGLRQQDWLITVFRPQLNPFGELASALVNLVEPDLDDLDKINKSTSLENTLQQENGLYQTISALTRKNPHRNILLFIDQFEEIFKIEEIQFKHFINCLINVVDQISELKLVMTLRADFCEKVYAYRPLLDKIQKSDLKLGIMNRQDVKDAIEKPVEGKAIFEPGLVNQILEDLGTDSANLPLLEFTLDELWKQGELTLKSYREIGGVREALAKRTNTIYESYQNKNEGKQVERLFRQLVAVSEDTANTRRILTRAQVENWDLVEKISSERILVIRQNEKTKEQTVELIHEALIQEWSRLRQWVNEKREDSIKFQRLENASKDWQTNRKQVGYLWQGQRLNDGIKLLKQQDEVDILSPIVHEFIKNSRQEQKKRIIRNSLIVTTSLVFIVGISKYYSDQDNIRKLKQSALRGGTSPEILSAIPIWLQEAEQKQKEGKDVEAITIARENARIIENWQKMLASKPEQYHQESINSISNKIKDFADKVEEQQVGLIMQYRLPKLERELKDNKIGQVNPDADLSKNSEQQYTEGALRTTYDIIFLDLGVASDPLISFQERTVATPNLVDTKEEADRIPYQILLEIEELWRRNTKKRSCGWLGSQGNGLSEPKCKELQGKSLLDIIFSDPVYVPMERLRQCKIFEGNSSNKYASPLKIVKPQGCK